MKLLLILLACSFTIAFLIVPIKTKKKPKRVDRNNRYKVPPVFWDDYNWISMKVHQMQPRDYDKVQHQINQFMYKYEQFIDFQVYNDRVGQLLHDYQKRVQLLLNNKHLTNGTSV